VTRSRGYCRAVSCRRQRLLHKRTRRFGLTFLDKGARDVQPSIGIAGLGFRHPVKGVFGAFQVSLQQQADAPIVPALAILFANHWLPVRLAQFDFGGSARQRDDGQNRNRPAIEGVLAAIVIQTR
jgi:hypothetical protein